MVEYELTEEEKETLNSLKEFSRKIDSIPEGEKIPISNPDKYEFPIGIDDKGNLNAIKDEDKDT